MRASEHRHQRSNLPWAFTSFKCQCWSCHPFWALPSIQRQQRLSVEACRRRPAENTEQEASDVKAGDGKKDFHPVVRVPWKEEITGGLDLLRMDFCTTSNKRYSKSWERLFHQCLLEILNKPLQMCQWPFFKCAFSANSPGTEIVEATATEIGCPQPASKNGHGDGVLNWFMRLKEALYVNGYWISVTCSHTESNSSYLVSAQFLGTCI